MAVKHCNVGKSLVFQEGVAPICVDPLVWQIRPVTKLPGAINIYIVDQVITWVMQ